MIGVNFLTPTPRAFNYGKIMKKDKQILFYKSREDRLLADVNDTYIWLLEKNKKFAELFLKKANEARNRLNRRLKKK